VAFIVRYERLSSFVVRLKSNFSIRTYILLRPMSGYALLNAPLRPSSCFAGIACQRLFDCENTQRSDSFNLRLERNMHKHSVRSLLMAVPLMALAACSSAPYTPVAQQGDPIDVNAYTKKVDTFIVLLDTSGSMKTEDDGRPRMFNAEDWTASFGNAVPPMDFQSAMVTFGKGATGSCIGYGIASTLYGPATFNSADFGRALGTLECAASTTPIAEAIDSTSTLLAEDTGKIAVIIVSDFNWNDPDAVKSSLAELRSQHPNNVCVHTVKVGNDTEYDAMISSMIDASGCDSAVAASAVASGPALSTYVADTLLTPKEKGLEYTTHTVSAEVLFDFDKSLLKEQGKAELRKLGQIIMSQGMAVGDIDVVGHTDSVGTDAYNQALSVRRAQAVKNFLVSGGISAGIIDVIGMGKRQPVASNDNAAGRAMNRRVDVLVGVQKPSK
jgi:OmpA-OmpF porin, OOP family